MSIVIAGLRPSDGFTVVENSTVRNAALSWRSRGLLTWLLSHAPGWETNVEGIIGEGDLGRDGVNSMLQELERAGHLRREQVRNPDGTLGRSKWLVYRIRTVDGLAVDGLAVDGSTVNGSAVNGASLIENQKKKTKDTSSKLDEADFMTVFEAWKGTKPNPAACLPNAARRKVVAARLKEGYSVEQLVEAVQAWPLDPWEGRKDHNDMVVLLRGENVERMRDLWLTRHPEPEPTWWIMLDVMADDGSVRCVRESLPGLDEASAIKRFRGTVAMLAEPGMNVTGRLVYPDGVTSMPVPHA
jgi:hypothetical protein